jgi:hypothetical protein
VITSKIRKLLNTLSFYSRFVTLVKSLNDILNVNIYVKRFHVLLATADYR